MSWARRKPYVWFITPGLLLYTVFSIYPIFSAIQISFNRWDGIGTKTFVGFANYVELFSNNALFSQLTNALHHTFTIFVMNACFVLPVQLFMAYMIYIEVRGFRFIQAMIFSPQFISTPVIVFMATLVLDSNIGVFNKLLEAVGLHEWVRPWLGLPQLGIYIVWLMGAWAGIGMGMIFFVGAMKMISHEIMEAALLDGASSSKRFFSIVLPQIKTTILNLLMLTYIFSITVFDYSFILGGSAGGVNHSVDVMALFFYRVAFGDNSAVGGTMNENAMGMGTTIACVMFAIIFIVALFQVVITFRKVEEE